MIDDESLRLIFKLAIVVYVALIVASLFIPRLEPSEELLEGIRGCPRGLGKLISMIGILMIAGSCIGLVGLFVGWRPARWIFAASILCKMTGTLSMPGTRPSDRWDAFRGYAEAFLDVSLVATSFIAADVLF